MKSDKLLLYAVTDRCWLDENTTLAMQVEQALKGGAGCIQLREKNLTDDKFLDLALEIKEICKKYGALFFINDNVEVAIKCSADGVHVGQSDMQAGLVREKIGKNMLLGVSVQTLQQATEALENGADYLGVGAVFNTSTKADAEPVSADELTAICSVADIPVVAIGGINENNILKLKGSGIKGVALVSAIFGANDIKAACQRLKSLAAEAVGKKISGAIFDLDGSLLDSMKIWGDLAEKYLLKTDKVPEPDLSEKIKSLSLSDGAEYLKEKYRIQLSRDEIIDGINEMIENFYNCEAELKEGAFEFLSSLKEKGIRMCVATTSDKRLAEAALKRCGVYGFFEDIISGDKQSADIYEKALALLKTKKNETVVFEDACYAAKTAKEADFFVCGVYDESEKEDLSAICDRYIKSFSEGERYFD